MKLLTSMAVAVGVLFVAALSIAAPVSAGGIVGVQVGVPGPGYGGYYHDYRAYCADPWYRQTYAYYCDRYYPVGYYDEGYYDEGYYDEGYYGGPSYGAYPYYGTLFSFGYANGYYNDYNHGYRGWGGGNWNWGGSHGNWHGGSRGHWGGGRHGNWSGHNGNRHGGRGHGRR